MTDDRWIVVPNWDRFQHYKKGRRPVWIKVYVALLDDPDYRGLTFGQRGILASLWLLYASSDGQVPYSAAYVAHSTGLLSEWDVRRMRVTGEADESELREARERMVRGQDLNALEKAGFIEVVASRPLALRYQASSLEVEVLRTSTKKAASAGRENAGPPAAKENPADPSTLARFDAWVKFEGYEYVDDPDAFTDELRRRKFVPGPSSPLAGELLERARAQL